MMFVTPQPRQAMGRQLTLPCGGTTVELSELFTAELREPCGGPMEGFRTELRETYGGRLHPLGIWGALGFQLAQPIRLDDSGAIADSFANLPNVTPVYVRSLWKKGLRHNQPPCSPRQSFDFVSDAYSYIRSWFEGESCLRVTIHQHPPTTL